MPLTRAAHKSHKRHFMLGLSHNVALSNYEARLKVNGEAEFLGWN